MLTGDRLGEMSYFFGALALGTATHLGVRYGFTRSLLKQALLHVGQNQFRPDLEMAGPCKPGGPLVVMVHGTFCCGRNLSLYQEEWRQAGIPVWIYEYPYLQSIVKNAGHFAKELAKRLRALPEGPPSEIYLVGYSQGGMVLRYALQSRLIPEPWRSKVQGFIQIASPNRGSDPADLSALLLSLGQEDAAPALVQLRPKSRFLARLNQGHLPVGLSYGAIYGVGQGRSVLGRFLTGRPEGDWKSRGAGLLYERWILPREEHDGLVTTTSSLSLVDAEGLRGVPSVRVETDHLGLLVDPQAATGSRQMIQRFRETDSV